MGEKVAIGGKRETRKCLHCGTRFVVTAREGEFCCSGCRYVYHLLHKRGLEDFYKYGERRMPVGSVVFDEREWEWLRREVARAEERIGDGEGGIVKGFRVRVQGVACAGCVWLIEEVFREQEGAIGAVVDSAAGTVELSWKKGECDLVRYAEDLKGFGYLLGPMNGEGSAKGHGAMRALTRRMGVCGALAMNATLFNLPRYLGLERGDWLNGILDGISFLLATASVLVGGPVFFRRAWEMLRRGNLHMDLPISLGLVVAYVGSVLAWKYGEYGFTYFEFLSVFTFLMLVGRWLQERAVEGNRRRLLELRVTPGFVRVLRDGIEREVGAEELREGERYWVRRNGIVPVRSKLLERKGVFGLQWITGEAEPRGFSLGGVVPGGAKNLGADEVSLVAMEGWSGSRLERLMRVGGGEGWRNVVLQRIMRGYLRVVILVGVCGFVGWLLSGGGWLKAMQVMISVWVVSCPCAIGVALPLLEDVAATVVRRFGVFVREKELWARLRKVKVILMDKTGTVTLERLGLKNPEAVDGLSQRAREVLLGMTMVSLHPVARCLREELMARGVEGMESVRVREVIGCGIEWARQEGTWRLGKAEWALWDVSHKGQREGTIFSLDGVEVAEFEFEEEVRPDASRQIQELERDGYEVWLLSGDRVEKVKRIGKELGVREERALGGLEPEEKAKLVEGRWGGCSLMLGDGANDSLAFDAALCRGTPAVDTGLLENKADFYLLGSGLQGLGKLFRMARRHGHTGRALFGFTVLYNFAVVCVSLCGWMNPLVAAIVMPASSLVSIGIVYIGLRIPSDWEEEGDVRSWSKEGNLSKARIFFETIKETKGEKYDERRS